MTPVWDIATPSRPSPLPGVTMAGFRDRSTAPVDLRVVPHPAVTLVVEFGAEPLVVDDATGREQRGSLVAGCVPGALRVRGEDIECLQVRLSPVIALAALGASPAELDRTVVTLDDVWGRDAERIRDQLRDATSWEDRFTITDALLLRRHQAGRAVDPEVARAWERIVATHGQVRVDALAAETGWSRKRLWARFQSQIGLSPKRAARLVRFDHAAHQLAAGRSAAWVAAEGGYADQSHLHRDVLTFTGATPTAVAEAPWLAVDDVAWPGQGTFVQDRRRLPV
jgi:AraC-like DNA-binding protein